MDVGIAFDYAGPTQPYQVGIGSVRRAPGRDLTTPPLSSEAIGKDVYYVTLTYTNRGTVTEHDPDFGIDVEVYSGSGNAATPIVVNATAGRCDTTPPRVSAPRRTVRQCGIFAVPTGQSVSRVSYRADEKNGVVVEWVLP